MGHIIKRKLKSGREVFYARFFDANGKRKLRKTDQLKLKDARTWLAQLEARIRNGQVGLVEPTPEEKARATITVKKLAEKFLEEYSRPGIKSMKNYRRDARSILSVRVEPDTR